jgi:GntR family transcriptional regulator
MTDDTVIDRYSIKHAYQQVADALAARITSGRYPVKLPSERALAEEFGVSYPTVRHAMAILRERGLIVSILGRGTFITPEDVDPDGPDGWELGASSKGSSSA